MRLAERAGLHRMVRRRVRGLPPSVGANPAGKVATVVAGMVAGADSIDDLDVVRHGGMPALFAGVYAPSTLGSFLRSFSHGHVLQLKAAARDVLVELAGRTPLLAGADQLCFVDIDSVLRRMYGRAKQAVAFGHTKVGGYPVLLRGGNAGSARGAASMVAQAIGATYDLRRLRLHGLIERIPHTHRYRVTEAGLHHVTFLTRVHNRLIRTGTAQLQDPDPPAPSALRAAAPGYRGAVKFSV